MDFAAIPALNAKDLADVPDNVKNALNIIPVATVDEVLAQALSAPLIPIEWKEEDNAPLAPLSPEDTDADSVITH